MRTQESRISLIHSFFFKNQNLKQIKQINKILFIGIAKQQSEAQRFPEISWLDEVATQRS